MVVLSDEFLWLYAFSIRLGEPESPCGVPNSCSVLTARSRHLAGGNHSRCDASACASATLSLLYSCGSKEKGTITTSFDMCVLDNLDRLPSVGDVIDRVLGLAARADYAKQPCRTN